MTGWFFKFAVEVMDSPLAGPLWDFNFRKSGIPQAVRELDMPEPATFQPIWPLPAALDKEEVSVEGKPVAERLTIAAQGIPGRTIAPSHSLSGSPVNLCKMVGASPSDVGKPGSRRYSM
jgi:hypothetical protein